MSDSYQPATLEEQREANQTQRTTQKAAVALYLAGADFEEIATRCNYSTAAVARVAVEKLIGETYKPTDLEAARNKARARYERLLQGVWFDATHPYEVDEDGRPVENRNEAHLPSLDRARSLIGDLARLDGLNAPSQLQVYVPGADEIMAVVSTLREAKMEGIAREADIFDEIEAEVVDDGEA